MGNETLDASVVPTRDGLATVVSPDRADTAGRIRSSLKGLSYRSQVQLLAAHRPPARGRRSVTRAGRVQAKQTKPNMSSEPPPKLTSEPPSDRPTPEPRNEPKKDKKPAPPPEGSATVLGISGDTEYGFTNRGAPDLIALLKKNPTATIDQILKILGDKEFKINYTQDPSFPQPGLHPTIASYGKAPPKPKSSGPGGKNAVLVANAKYTAVTQLNAVTKQAQSLQSELGGRGFVTNLTNDLNAATMGARYQQLVSTAKAGDELVAFFTGHGLPAGLCGINYSPSVNDIYATGQVSRLLSQATARGAHIRFIVDACHAGNVATTVRTQRVNKLAKETSSIPQKAWLALAKSAMKLKSQLVAHSNARHQALQTMDATIAGVRTMNPPLVAVLQNQRVTLMRGFDQKADQTWAAALSFLELAATAINLTQNTSLEPPKKVKDYSRLGGVIDFLDSLANAATQPLEDARKKKRHISRTN